LRCIPHITQKDVFEETISKVRATAEDQGLKHLLDWLEHKDRNPWVLRCVSPAMTEMSKHDWQVTSFTTNIAESAHAMAQREGKKLSLLAAVLKGKNVDLHFLQLQRATCGFGVTAHYGNTFMTGRKMLALSRQKAKARKKALKSKEKPDDLSDT